MFVEVEEGFGELGGVAGGEEAIELANTVKFGEEHTLSTGFKDQVDMSAVEEVAISTKDILVTSVVGNFDFTSKLNSNIVTCHGFDFEAFEGDDEVAATNRSEQDTTILTTTKVVKDFEIFHTPLGFGARGNDDWTMNGVTRRNNNSIIILLLSLLLIRIRNRRLRSRIGLTRMRKRKIVGELNRLLLLLLNCSHFFGIKK